MAIGGWWQRLGRAVGAWLDNTDRRAAEEALAAREAELRAAQSLLTDALESSSDAFTLYDADDRLLAFNSRYKEFYPTIADDIRPGVSFATLSRLSAERGQYLDVGPERVEDWVRERMAHHRKAVGVFEQRLSDGRFLEIVERPTSGGGRVAIRRDVTVRKRIEDALRRELTFEQTLIDALPFPVFFKGCDGRFLGCNTKFAEAMGRPSTDIIGHTLHDLMPEAQAAEYTATDQELFAQPGVQTREVTLRWADGSFRHLNVVKGTFAVSQGQVAGLVGSLIDITAQKRTEEQLVQTAKLATLGQIASEVAHELNQPLSIILMSAESCLLDLDGERTRLERRLSAILGQVRRMAEIVDHLRSFSRMDTGERRPFAPAPVAGSALRLLAPHFQLDGIALESVLDAACPEVLGQPTQLEQVLLNLLSNARDAVREHRPKGDGRVAVRLWAEGDWVHLSVEDNGGGVPEDAWPQVFEPFYTTKGAGTGTGLGLSISANIVEGMGGRIGGRNAGGGAIFQVSVPVHRPVPGAVPAGGGAVPETAPPLQGGPRGRVLVVDDEELAVECIAEYLGARGFEVLTANSADGALALARQGGIDLLVTDLRLPGLSGTALMERLRREHRELPVILMTGGPLPATDFGSATGLLGKPLALAELLRLTERLLRERATPCVA